MSQEAPPVRKNARGSITKVLDKWEQSYTANRDDWYGWDYCCIQNLRDALWDISTNAVIRKNPEDIEF